MSTPLETLTWLADDASADVRIAVAENASTPRDVRRRIREQDADADVRHYLA